MCFYQVDVSKKSRGKRNIKEDSYLFSGRPGSPDGSTKALSNCINWSLIRRTAKGLKRKRK